MRHLHTRPRVTAVVLDRLYPQTFSLADALAHLAAGAAPAGQAQPSSPPLQLVRPGDSAAYLRLLRRATVAVPPDAPRLQTQGPLRLSQRSLQEQVRATLVKGRAVCPTAAATDLFQLGNGLSSARGRPERRPCSERSQRTSSALSVKPAWTKTPAARAPGH